jgi:hypothetical protein
MLRKATGSLLRPTHPLVESVPNIDISSSWGVLRNVTTVHRWHSPPPPYNINHKRRVDMGGTSTVIRLLKLDINMTATR